MRAWRAIGLVCAVVFYAISMSGGVYNLTSPVTLPHHEIYRKTYALLAFAVLGFAFERSEFRRVRGVAAVGIAIALYSWAIEIGQIFIDASTETLADHSFDVASGLAGGALGAFVALLVCAPLAPQRRTEAAAVAIVLALVAWGFTLTYGRI